MHEAEGVNFSVGFIKSPIAGKDIRRIQSTNSPKDSPSFADVLNFIDRLNISAEDKERLVKTAKKIPFGSLRNFVSNYRNYLKRDN